MASSTFTPNLGIEEPATGMYANTWGNVANRSYRVLDAAIGGNAPIVLTGSPGTPQTLNTAQGADAANGLYPLIFWTGTQATAGGVRITPATEQRLYVMSNQTTVPITFSQSAGGTSFILQPGYAAQIYCDGGGNVGASVANHQVNNLLVTGNLQVDGVVNAPSLGLGSPTSVPDPLTIQGLGSGGYGQIRLAYGNYGVLFRNDGSSFYIMNTASGSPYGTWASAPFQLNLANGVVTLSALSVSSVNVTGAVIVDAGATNNNQIDIAFGGATGEGIGSSRASGAPNLDGLTFFTSGAARVYITSGGGVGIGVIPDQLLTVNGWIHSASGGFQFPDGTTQATAAVTFTMPANPTFTTVTTTGAATVGATLSVGGAATVASMHSTGIVNASGYQINGTAFNPGIAGVTLYSGGVSGGTFTGIGITGVGVQVTFSGGAYGSYTITYPPSDSRVKRNVHPLEGGLSIINRLRPVQAEYNGLGGTRDGERVVSVMAEELSKVLPGAVFKVPRKLRESDQKETDLLHINPQEILFQLVLAVQQIAIKLGWSGI